LPQKYVKIDHCVNLLPAVCERTTHNAAARQHAQHSQHALYQCDSNTVVNVHHDVVENTHTHKCVDPHPSGRNVRRWPRAGRSLVSKFSVHGVLSSSTNRINAKEKTGQADTVGCTYTFGLTRPASATVACRADNNIRYALTTFPFFVQDLLGNGIPTTSHSRITSVPHTTSWSRGPSMICAGAVTHNTHSHSTKKHSLEVAPTTSVHQI